MKKLGNIFGIIAVVAVFGLAMTLTGCDTDPNNSIGGKIPAVLVGNWHNPVTDSLVITIASTGKLTNVNVTYDASVSGNTITVVNPANSSISGSFDYSLSADGMTMSLSNGTGICSTWPSSQPTLNKK